MTITEVSEKYKIPLALLQRYAAEKTRAEGTDENRRQADSYRFTDSDIEQLSVRMTLQDIGFAEEEIAAYLRLRQGDEKSAEACLNMLNKLRSRTLRNLFSMFKQAEQITQQDAGDDSRQRESAGTD